MQFEHKISEHDVTNPPPMRELAVTDVDAYIEIHRHSWDLKYEQLSRGAFRASKRLAQWNDVVLYRETHDQTMRAVGANKPGTLCLAVLNQAGKSGRFWGKTHPDHGLVFISGSRHPDLILERGYDAIIAIVPENEIRERIGILTGTEPIFFDTGSSVLEITAGAEKVLRSSLEGLLEMGCDSLKSDSLVDRIATLVADAIPDPPFSVKAPSARSGLVRRALELADSRKNMMSVSELCLTLRVSRRALNYAFTSQVGESPRAYLMHRRLNCAHRTLLGSDPSLATVSSIAGGCGFHELGRFSVRYRKLFGESPSATLKRSYTRFTT